MDDIFEPPDVAIEILSPGQSLRGMNERCRWFVANGVPAAVAVNPRRRTVAVYRADGTEATLRAGDVLDLDDIVPGLRDVVFSRGSAKRFSIVSFQQLI